MTSRKIDILQSVINAWCERQDIDAVLAHLTEDVVWHHSAVTKEPKIGHQGAREFLTAYKEHVRNPAWRMFSIAETGDSLLVEGVDEFDTKDGHHVVIPYMGILEFRRDRICAWRDYFDRGVADRGAQGETLPDFARALTNRPAVLQAG